MIDLVAMLVFIVACAMGGVSLLWWAVSGAFPWLLAILAFAFLVAAMSLSDVEEGDAR